MLFFQGKTPLISFLNAFSLLKRLPVKGAKLIQHFCGNLPVCQAVEDIFIDAVPNDVKFFGQFMADVSQWCRLSVSKKSPVPGMVVSYRREYLFFLLRINSQNLYPGTFGGSIGHACDHGPGGDCIHPGCFLTVDRTCSGLGMVSWIS